MIFRAELFNRSAAYCVVALMFVAGCGDRRNQPLTPSAGRVFVLSLQRQLPLEKGCALPVAYNSDLILADDSGGVRRLNSELETVWMTRLTGAGFECSGSVHNGRLLLAARAGKVFALDAESGAVIWEKAFDAVFSQPPLCGTVDGEPVLWLLAQSDGVLYALKVADGGLLWSGAATNRSDGNAALWQNKLAYGNCDGAVHIFNAGTGTKIASVAIGSSDQMAGTPLSDADGMLWIGTHAGRLALVDIDAEELKAAVKISENEAFVPPVAAFDAHVAVGVSEGRVLLCRSDAGQLLIVKEQLLAGGIDALRYDGALLYVLAGGTLSALNAELGIEASLNVGDRASGVAELGNGVFAVTADRSLLLIKGEWK